MKSKAWTEKVMQGVFFIAACTSVLAVALICIFCSFSFSQNVRLYKNCTEFLLAIIGETYHLIRYVTK